MDTATHLTARIVILRVLGESKFVASALEDPKVSVSADHWLKKPRSAA